MQNNNSPEHIVTRFAPSPTGFLHIGGVRTALFAWLYARKHSGTFILRIEDTDKAREVEGSVAHIMESLRWLGIEWDYGPDKPGPYNWSEASCLQSERLPLYRAWAEKLLEKGLAYPDPYSAEALATFREQAEKEGRQFLFRYHRPETIGKWDGTQPLRFKVPQIKRYEWDDAVRGNLSAGEEALDDFIILKADGYPTYNFAHVIDDYDMGVTHVMRGEEFISSTPKFLSLIDALELPRPVYVTLPPIMGPDGKKKLSKRDGAKDLLDYRRDGYLPSAMCNFLSLIGWNPGGDRELFTTSEELIEAFSLEKIQRSGGAFNGEKLDWMNKEHLDATFDEGARIEYVTAALPERDAPTLRKLAPTILERCSNQRDIRDADANGEFDWAFTDISYDTDLLRWKNDDNVTAAQPRLAHLTTLLSDADFSSPDTIKAALWPYAEEVGKGEVLWPLRVALTGRERSPDPFTCAYVLGSTITLDRITTACAKIAGNE